ncbi:MarR family winged helix-turn-helix transcriptional regulator [Yinghuangia soli]|uniref:MarR family transcriptional regulator n=1 Tax=Yinghuangia soli TaxID=2908204 RepID=A0AA41U4S4_9ACTN|nr:MarR family transcriptional regulator [Yinghuangia soli]MCF2533266.1 MarR family transcriptional regulator [Yinghuangia soli]
MAPRQQKSPQRVTPAGNAPARKGRTAPGPTGPGAGDGADASASDASDASGQASRVTGPATGPGADPAEDSVDRHIARWRGRAPFDERVEGIVTRMQFLVKHVAQAKRHSLAEVGLQDFEFETLHRLAARRPPGRAAGTGRATPSELAAELLVSPAGMTGRLDTLEEAGLIRRIRSTEDRRRVDVEMTDLGRTRWESAMHLMSAAETDLVAPLGPDDRDVLDALLKRMLAHAEQAKAGDPAAPRADRPRNA